MYLYIYVMVTHLKILLFLVSFSSFNLCVVHASECAGVCPRMCMQTPYTVGCHVSPSIAFHLIALRQSRSLIREPAIWASQADQ